MSLTQLRSRGILDGTITAGDFASGVGGKVLQVVSTVKTADQSTTSTSPVDVTDLSLNITPSSATNKILVFVNINNISNENNNITYFKILRGATVLSSNSSGGAADTKDAFGSAGGGGMASGNDNRKLGSANITFLDSPSSTSSLTYKVTMEVGGGTGTINRWQLDVNAASVSTLTLMEIAG